jgi:hypothetical protein
VTRQEQEDTDAAENAGFTTTEPEKMLHGILVAIGDTLSDIASAYDVEDGADEHDE